MFKQGLLPDDAIETFLTRRIVVLAEDITSDTQDLISAHLLYLNVKSKEPITLWIQSDGGSLHSTNHVMDAIRNSNAPIYGVVGSTAGSGAFMILQECHRRLAYPNAHLMFHAPDLSGLRVDDPSFKNTLESIVQEHKANVKKIARRAGQKVSTVAEWSRTEHSFTACEALKVGLLDEVIDKPVGK